MVSLRIETHIRAPKELVFDLFRDIDLHTKSVAWTRERIVSGKTHGKFEVGDIVTWEAVHLGVRQQLVSKITEMVRPKILSDEMQKGAFKQLHHRRYFRGNKENTIVVDELNFASPFGLIGKIFDHIFLAEYMRRFIERRNAYIKQIAESQ